MVYCPHWQKIARTPMINGNAKLAGYSVGTESVAECHLGVSSRYISLSMVTWGICFDHASSIKLLVFQQNSCIARIVLKVKNDHCSKFSQFKQLERRSLKKKIRASTGFEPVTSALPVHCSTNWAMKPHIGSEVNLLSSYLPWGVKWCEVYEIIHFWTAVVDESEEWSSQ